MSKVPRKGRPRETFRINGDPNTVTMVSTRQPDTKWESLGKAADALQWKLESKAEVNLLIRELEEARDRVFPSDDDKLRSALSDLLWEAYVSGNPDCILTTREGREEVVENILTRIATGK